jgi:hypothetical protein
VLKDREFPAGWSLAADNARKEMRAKRKVFHARLWRVLMSHRLRVGVVLVIGIVVGWWLISFGYSTDWSGWKGKKLWDWLRLLGVPLTLAAIAYLFRRQEAKTDREIAAEQHQQKLLQDYFDRLSKFLVDKQLEVSESDHRIRPIARVLTLAALRRADPLRRGEILRFLYEAKLIQKGNTIIDLHGADFSGASLRAVNLEKSDLGGAILKGCDLQMAILRAASLNDAILDRVNLDHANLEGAQLIRATMNGTQLGNALLMGSNLKEAKLRSVALVS